MFIVLWLQEGEKALGSALAVAIGVLTHHVRVVWSEQKQEVRDEKDKSRSLISQKLKLLRKIEAALEELSELLESENLDVWKKHYQRHALLW